MKITDVRTAKIKGNFNWVLVKVFTDEGIVGLGESYWGVGVDTVVRQLRDLVVGEDPHNIDWLFQKLVRGTSGEGSTGGIVISAISGIELALWDIKGKALNTPIYNLLGGKYRNKIKAYADCGHGDHPTPSSWGDRARKAVAKGFKAIKFDIDNILPETFADPHHIASNRGGWLQGQQQPVSNKELDLMVNLIAGVRETVGPEIDIAVDCHWNYNTRDVIRMSQAFEPFRLIWMEDPTPPDNVEALKRVTDNSPVPICSGESHFTRHGLRQMIITQAVDVLQPDIPKVGGLLEAKKIADLADIYYMPVAAHNVCSPVGTMAACHTCASMRNFTVIEFHGQDVPWWDDLVEGDSPMIKDGYITLPDKPGLGLELIDEVAQAHLAKDSTYFK